MTTVYYASQLGAALDSDVYRGGGTDDTAILQAVLDKAKDDDNGVCLVMDGASLITGLELYSNTTIRCLDKSCGFYLADHSDRAVVANARRDNETIRTRNITLEGGTYNQNAPGQAHHIVDEEKFYHGHGVMEDATLVVALFFVGVENLLVRDLTIVDQRTYAFLASNWNHVDIDRVRIELPARVHGQNQDGFHFFGPGRFLNIRNVSGRTSDDFIALAPDENDDESSIEDVLIDGVMLDDADQAIRMLCHAKGRLDRVTVRNVTGTYRSFGFFLNPFWPSSEGSYGRITFDNIDLRQTAIDYEYTPSFLFRIGGRIESLTLRNIVYHRPNDDRGLVDVGWQFYSDQLPIAPEQETRIGSLLLEGIQVYETSAAPSGGYVKIKQSHISHLAVRNVDIIQSGSAASEAPFLQLLEGADVELCSVRGITAPFLPCLIEANAGRIGRLILSDVQISSESGEVIGSGVGTQIR